MLNTASRLDAVTEVRSAIVTLALMFVVMWIAYGVPLQNLMYDPSFYYAHIRSPLIDGDLNFANEGAPPELAALRTRTGLVASLWSVGPAVSWSPFVLVAHGMTKAAQRIGIDTAADGYTPIYLTLCALGSAFWGWVGVVCCYCLGRSVAANGPALLAAIAVWLASPLFFYMYRIPLYAHAPTVALIGAALCVSIYVNQHPRNIWPWLLLGLLIGMATLMRWQNGLFALLVPFAFPASAQIDQGGRWRAVVVRSLVAAGGALCAFMPQTVVWWRLYGSPLAVPQGSSFFHWFEPNLVPLLVGSNRGVFIWQPITWIGLAGLLIYCWRSHRIGAALMLIAVLETYLNSVVSDWWGGGGYGPRRFDWAIPILALGAARFFQITWSQRGWRIGWICVVASLIVYQLALAQAFYYRVMPDGQPFPIAAYDQGQPLPDSFFISLIQGTLHHPPFLLHVTSSIWSSATPLWLEVWRAYQAHSIGAQVAASGIATLLAAGLVWMAAGWICAITTFTIDPIRVARLTSIVLLIVVGGASVIFALIGR